jgi:hypothetical protein
MKIASKAEGLFLTLILAGAVQGIGCNVSTDMQEGDSLRVLEQGGWSNSISINGVGENGVGENGGGLHGEQLKGVHQNGFTLNGVALSEVQVLGAQLQGTRTDTGGIVGGEGFEGVLLRGLLSDDRILRMKIDAVDPTADPELFNYTVRYWDGAAWRSLCGEKDGAPIQAIPLQGRWDLTSGTAAGGDFIADPTMLTWACHGSALAKCVVFGYKPWQWRTECNGGSCQQVSLREVHQACTRMVRADYCGDGTPHTRNGTPINLWDALGVQPREVTSQPWRLDAEWSSGGALCIEHLRWDDNGATTAYINSRCPQRWLSSFTCFGGDSTFFTASGYSTPLSERSLMRNEFNHDYTP